MTPTKKMSVSGKPIKVREAIGTFIIPPCATFTQISFANSLHISVYKLRQRLIEVGLVWADVLRTYKYFGSERNVIFFKKLHLEGWDNRTCSDKLQQLGATALLTPSAVGRLERVMFGLDDHTACTLPSGTRDLVRQKGRSNTFTDNVMKEVLFDCPIDSKGLEEYVTAAENLRLWILARATRISEDVVSALYGSSGHNWLSNKKWTWILRHWQINHSKEAGMVKKLEKKIVTLQTKYDALRLASI
jgi:hypothetical protein